MITTLNKPVQADAMRKKIARRGPLRRQAPFVQTRLGSQLQFLGAFVRDPLTVGAFWPSSARLARQVVASCDFGRDDLVVELGPGTGAFTELILERLGTPGRFLALEINRSNAEVLRRRFPRCKVINDSAQNLAQHLGAEKVDCIISGLAWGNMLPRTQDRIFNAIRNCLAPGGQFVAFAYVHALWFPTTLRFRRRFFSHFAHVETTPIIWRNLPPAYIYRGWQH